MTTSQRFVDYLTASRWNRNVLVPSVIVWLAIALTGLQTWQDRRAAERAAYAHMIDSARQIEQGVRTIVAATRALTTAASDTLAPDGRGPSGCAPPTCDDELIRLQKRFTELLPGVELLAMGPQGDVVAATESDVLHRVAGLRELPGRFRAAPDAVVLAHPARNSHGEPAMLVAQARRGPSGDPSSITVLLVPMSLFGPILRAPQLGPARAIVLTETDGTLLARDPPPWLEQIGGKAKLLLEDRRPALVAGSFVGRSEIDGVERLWITREVPFPRASGGLQLYVGTAVEDYLASWHRSTLLNVVVCLTLVLAWTWSLYVFRRDVRTRSRLVGTVSVMHKIMESTPVPVVVVSRALGQVVMSNGAMLDAFGALAAVGQPLKQAFGEAAASKCLVEGTQVAPVVELLSRKGPIHAELRRTDLGDVGTDGPCWLVVLIDVSERHRREQHLQLAAATDVLTGLANRRQFTYEAEEAIQVVRERGMPLSVLMLDLDFFKTVNDTHGHDVGDLVLITVAKVFKGTLRDGDLAARLGGEEFAALLPGADQRRAIAVGERIRQAIAGTPILLPDNQVLTVTVSIGVSLWHIDDEDIGAMLKRADQALYAAKEKGRNRVESGEDAGPSRG
jgi:diguanylate cyclase (GGDEF)-like protein